MALSQITKVSLALAVVALLGVGCNKSDSQSLGVQPRADAEPTVDAGDRVPKGWQWYENEEGGYEIAYPPGWKVTEDGGLYKDAPNLEQLLEESQGHFVSIMQVAPTSIGVGVFDPEGRTVDELWEDGKDDSEVDTYTTIDGLRGRVAKCGGIRYGECVYLIREGRAYVILVSDMSITKPPPNAEIEILQNEVQQILDTFQFLP